MKTVGIVYIVARNCFSLFLRLVLVSNAEALVAATREIGLEVSADKTKYMVMSRDQNAG